MDEQERFEFGLTTRKSVLGEAHVDRALAGRTAFNTEFQDLITRYAWGRSGHGPQSTIPPAAC
ncbi:hypothetical protein [Nitrospirillum sp. BR 11163]|uniref:hypothetical protein n=1 Tax=Nitrospirillum sp. BR 11163 TaxID=3104323 RepID=UPI002B002149|nr:hypothetical protein [Nitrospirillum sp. BR 11163]MEA1672143.1 hypothetical protein [Nitrospirillum sp. BR 11163]